MAFSTLVFVALVKPTSLIVPWWLLGIIQIPLSLHSPNSFHFPFFFYFFPIVNCSAFTCLPFSFIFMLLFLLFHPCPGWRKEKTQHGLFFHHEAGKVKNKNPTPNCHITSSHERKGGLGTLSSTLSPTPSLSLYLMFPPSSWMELPRSHQHLLSDFCESHQPTYLIATNSLHWKLHHHFFLFLYLPHFRSHFSISTPLFF